MPAPKGLPYFEDRIPKCSSMTMQAYHLKATPPKLLEALGAGLPK